MNHSKIDFDGPCPCATLAQIREQILETRYAAMVTRAFAQEARLEAGATRRGSLQLRAVNTELREELQASLACIRHQIQYMGRRPTSQE